MKRCTPNESETRRRRSGDDRRSSSLTERVKDKLLARGVERVGVRDRVGGGCGAGTSRAGGGGVRRKEAAACFTASAPHPELY